MELRLLTYITGLPSRARAFAGPKWPVVQRRRRQ